MYCIYSIYNIQIYAQRTWQGETPKVPSHNNLSVAICQNSHNLYSKHIEIEYSNQY